MVHPTLFFWLLVAGLDPHACGQGVPDQENHPTPMNLSASSTFLNNSHFAFSLYRRVVAANPGKNIIFSPLSFSIPLTLLALQARPAVRMQVLEGLGFPLTQVPENGVHAHYSQQLLASVRPLAASGADVGSLLFVDQKRYLAQRFVNIAQNLYHTEVFPIPFGNNRVAREQMDHFISKMTHGKIGTLAQELNPDTVLILANYIFFKGKWKILFDPKLTEIRPFSVSEGVKIMVPMMQRPGWFQLQRFYHLHSYVLRLPCSSHTTAVFILPDTGKARDTDEALMRENFDTWSQPFPLSSRRRLYFPKFSFSGKRQLEQLLPSMGMSDISSYCVGITGISLQTIPLRISRAVHTAELSMDETGAEAEDTSGLQSLPRSHLPPFHFNRPFLLLMFEEGGRKLFFMGKVMNPRAKS
uniref:Serpin domain-containing protein n=1 Tax=Ailuropoda melanoleuca TaxID=9646 RepID=G1LI90_AILME